MAFFILHQLKKRTLIFTPMIQISIPKGTRDFAPETLRKRHYIMNIIKHIFEKYAFEPLETPAMENIETLTG